MNNNNEQSENTWQMLARNKETQGLYLANRSLPEALLFTIVNSNEAKAASQDSLPGVGFPSASLRKREGQRL